MTPNHSHGSMRALTPSASFEMLPASTLRGAAAAYTPSSRSVVKSRPKLGGSASAAQLSTASLSTQPRARTLGSASMHRLAQRRLSASQQASVQTLRFSAATLPDYGDDPAPSRFAHPQQRALYNQPPPPVLLKQQMQSPGVPMIRPDGMIVEFPAQRPRAAPAGSLMANTSAWTPSVILAAPSGAQQRRQPNRQPSRQPSQQQLLERERHQPFSQQRRHYEMQRQNSLPSQFAIHAGDRVNGQGGGGDQQADTSPSLVTISSEEYLQLLRGTAAEHQMGQTEQTRNKPTEPDPEPEPPRPPTPEPTAFEMMMRQATASQSASQATLHKFNIQRNAPEPPPTPPPPPLARTSSWPEYHLEPIETLPYDAFSTQIRHTIARPEHEYPHGHPWVHAKAPPPNMGRLVNPDVKPKVPPKYTSGYMGCQFLRTKLQRELDR